jgi:hypothetical protein
LDNIWPRINVSNLTTMYTFLSEMLFFSNIGNGMDFKQRRMAWGIQGGRIQPQASRPAGGNPWNSHKAVSRVVIHCAYKFTTHCTKNAPLLNCCKAPCEWNLNNLVRSGKSSIRWRECDQPGPFLIIRLEVTAVWKWHV